MTDPRAAAMSERELENGIRRILKGLPPVLAYHTHDSRHSASGFPDWVFCSGTGILYRELKKQSGVVTMAQQQWLDMLGLAGADAYVWRPADLLNGTIAFELARVAGLPVRREVS